MIADAMKYALGCIVLLAACAGSDDGSAESSDAPPGILDASVAPDSAGCEDDVCADRPRIIDGCSIDHICISPFPETGIDTIGLAGIWGSGPQDIWTVGNSGYAAHFDGTRWTPSRTPTDQGLRSLWGSGPHDVWTASTANVIFHSSGFTETGANWAPVGIRESTEFILGITGTSSSGIYMVGDAYADRTYTNPIASNVWHNAGYDPASDAGASWTDVVWCNYLLPHGQPSSCNFGEAKARKDLSAIWVAPSDPSVLWVAGKNGVLYSIDNSRDGGEADASALPTITAFDSFSKNELTAIWGASSRDVWVVGRRGMILRLRAGHAAFETVPSPTSEDLLGIWGSDANDLWIVGAHGVALHGDGESWTQMEVPFEKSSVIHAVQAPALRAVWGSSARDVWMVGDQVILRWKGSAQ